MKRAGISFPNTEFMTTKESTMRVPRMIHAKFLNICVMSKSWMPVMLLAAGLSLSGCNSKSTEEEDSGGAAVGGTMEIAVPSPFQLAVVVFKTGDGNVLGRVEPVTESSFEYTRGDESVVQFNLEKKKLTAQDSEGTALFEIVRDGDEISITSDAEGSPSWTVKYVGAVMEIYQGSESPLAVMRWIQDENEYLKDEVHLIDADEKVQTITYLENGSTLTKDEAGTILFEAEGLEGRRPMACLSVQDMSVDQQIALAVFLASQ